MIDPQMPIAPVCGPVAIVSWGAREDGDVPVSEIPPEIARFLPDSGRAGRSSLDEVFHAIARFIAVYRPIHVSPVCAVLPLRRLGSLSGALDRLQKSGRIVCCTEVVRLMPERDVIADLKALVALGIMTRDAAAKRIEQQAKIWGRLEDTLQPRMVISRIAGTLGDMADLSVDQTTGPQVLCRDSGPWTPPSGAGLLYSPQTPEDQELARMVCSVRESIGPVAWAAWILAQSRVGRVVMLHYGRWRAMLAKSHSDQSRIVALSRSVAEVLLVPIGCPSAAEATRAIWGRESSDGDGLERLAEQARVWREAWQAIQRGSSPLGGVAAPAGVA